VPDRAVHFITLPFALNYSFIEHDPFEPAGANSMEIAAWLRNLGLERYEPAFRANDVDATVLPELTAEDLTGLGVTSIGHRRKLLAAIATLRTGLPPTLVPAAAPHSRAGHENQAKPTVTEAERRQLTVLFCDLVGSTALSSQLDPEDMREVILAYQGTCAGAITRFEGHVARYMGDGVLAYFGYPRAHEDEAERAVRAGLVVTKAISRLAAPDGTPLAARVGIATGLVVVGDLVGHGAAQEQAVIGETPNLAARLQALAEPGSVVIALTTRRLVGGLFTLAELGAQPLKGFARPMPSWRVVGASTAESRFEAFHAAGLTALVGRDEELNLLRCRWQQAKGGAGQVVLLSGEAGIGKSHITRVLRERLRGEPHTCLNYSCSPYHVNSALHPVIEQLERAANFAREDPPERQLDGLEALFGHAVTTVPQAASLIAALLGIPSGGRYPLLNLSPQRQKDLTLEALLAQFGGLAAQRPVLMVFEDVHWSDPTSRDLLERTVDRLRHWPVLLIITFRPEFTPPWTDHPHVTRLSLDRLNRCQAAILVKQVTGGKVLPTAVLEQIIAKADGEPLFLEELTKTVLEAGLLRDQGDCYVLTGALPPLAIPATLHDSLMARLDRLSPIKEVAQIGATLGRVFSYELLAVVVAMPEIELQEALSQLTASDLVVRNGTPSQAIYCFKHALVQDTAYASLLLSRRQQLHGRIARILEERFPETVARQPELLAHHWTQASLVEKAIVYWEQAGRLAVRRSAMVEAISHFRMALDLLETLPETPERAANELDLQTALGGTLIVVKGYSAPETGRAYARAGALRRMIGDAGRLFPLLFGQWVFHLVRAELDTSLATAQELLGLADGRKDTAALVIGHRAVGISSLWLGRPDAARGHLNQVLALYDPDRHRPLASLYTYDLRVPGLAGMSVALLQLGYSEQALARNRDALGVAENLAHPASLACALKHACVFHQLCRDGDSVRERAAQLIALASEQGFPYWLAAGLVFGGWARVQHGRIQEGMEQIDEGLAAYRTTGATLLRPYFLALAAEAHTRGNRRGEALRLLREALTEVDRSGERWFEAELHRLAGELLRSDQVQAESCFRRAIEVASKQGAKTWELRAVTSLSRLWHEQERRAEALTMLSPIYGWFTEGLNTADLRDARALLNELGRTPPSAIA
jgi:predicted ATPase/class 3 adenylate cyclase